jgi:hypothetical protein
VSVVAAGEARLDRTDRPGGVDDQQSPRDAPAQGYQRPERAFAAHNSSTNCPISHRPRPQGLARGAVWGAGGPVADRRLDPAVLHPDGHLDRLEVQEPRQDGVGDGLADGQHTSPRTSPVMAAGSCCKLVRTARRSPAGQVGEPATETSSYRPLPALRPSWSGGGSCRPG